MKGHKKYSLALSINLRVFTIKGNTLENAFVAIFNTIIWGCQIFNIMTAETHKANIHFVLCDMEICAI